MLEEDRVERPRLLLLVLLLILVLQLLLLPLRCSFAFECCKLLTSCRIARGCCCELELDGCLRLLVLLVPFLLLLLLLVVVVGLSVSVLFGGLFSSL